MVALSTFTVLCNLYHYILPKLFHFLKLKLQLLNSNSSSPHLTPPVTFILPFCVYESAILGRWKCRLSCISPCLVRPHSRGGAEWVEWWLYWFKHYSWVCSPSSVGPHRTFLGSQDRWCQLTGINNYSEETQGDPRRSSLVCTPCRSSLPEDNCEVISLKLSQFQRVFLIAEIPQLKVHQVLVQVGKSLCSYSKKHKIQKEQKDGHDMLPG